jgi:hypothetical protein
MCCYLIFDAYIAVLCDVYSDLAYLGIRISCWFQGFVLWMGFLSSLLPFVVGAVSGKLGFVHWRSETLAETRKFKDIAEDFVFIWWDDHLHIQLAALLQAK